MQRLDLTLDEPEANLALDEALLDEAEHAGEPLETLRLWEPTRPMIVIGTSSRVADEVHEQRAAELGVPVLRRVSGGLAIITGPGCLMYSLILSYRRRPLLRSLDEAHAFVLSAIADALDVLVPGVERRGTSDLTLAGKKFSGNSVRCKREHLLYHGTLLNNFPLKLISECLKHPHRQPEYRESRAHDEFVRNLGVNSDALRDRLAAAFGAMEMRTEWPEEETRRLVDEKYRQREWNYRA